MLGRVVNALLWGLLMAVVSAVELFVGAGFGLEGKISDPIILAFAGLVGSFLAPVLGKLARKIGDKLEKISFS